MASFVCRSVFAATRRGVSTTAVRAADKAMNDPLEHATGLEKREILAKQAGREDPYEMQVYKRVAGTKEKPNLVPSVADHRVVGCVCEEDATAINWMWLYKGEPKRCECGYWFKLIDSKPV
ncbi:hypothetical protein GHT06_008396 [Daphnia sinensis]|uniref:Cytochrome c oxidase subunit 5B, mitochondrial n=1 Tax=Daphnia sinensis TaxID=1820382 RepID=A0AAD5LL11_9CRUS|nr:hypothetical protein GHT06_008396 [Daphnia sinensis]